MNGFFNDSNLSRVDKMLGLINGPMTKSAKSNKATPADWAEMLDRLSTVIAEKVGEASATPPEHPPTTLRAPPSGDGRITLKDQIDSLPLTDLTTIISLCSLRIDAAAYELEKIEKETRK